jgi:hypothetical protein
VTGPFARIRVSRRRAVQRATTLATVGLLAAIVALGLPLRTIDAPLGLVSLQLAASPDVAAGMLDSWDTVARYRVLLTHGLDLLLPFLYALAVGTAATRAAAGVPAAGPAAQVAAGAVIVAAIADQIENIAMAFTILVAPSWGSVLVTLASATVKFATLALALGALGFAVQQARRSGVTMRAGGPK